MALKRRYRNILNECLMSERKFDFSGEEQWAYYYDAF